MKLKVPMALLLAGSISALGIAASKNTVTIAKGTPKTGISALSAPVIPASKAQQNQANALDQPGIIDGAKNPELIPDQVAFSLLFRVISGNQSPEAKQRMRHYVRQIGLGDQTCYACNGQKPPTDKAKDQEIDTFIAVADEFQQRIGVLDEQAAEIKKRSWPPSLQAMTELTQLQQQKEAITREIVASLPKRLGTEGSNKVWKHVTDRVKKKARIRTNVGQSGAPSLALLPSNALTR